MRNGVRGATVGNEAHAVAECPEGIGKHLVHRMESASSCLLVRLLVVGVVFVLALLPSASLLVR